MAPGRDVRAHPRLRRMCEAGRRCASPDRSFGGVRGDERRGAHRRARLSARVPPRGRRRPRSFAVPSVARGARARGAERDRGRRGRGRRLRQDRAARRRGRHAPLLSAIGALPAREPLARRSVRGRAVVRRRRGRRHVSIGRSAGSLALRPDRRSRRGRRCGHVVPVRPRRRRRRRIGGALRADRAERRRAREPDARRRGEADDRPHVSGQRGARGDSARPRAGRGCGGHGRGRLRGRPVCIDDDGDDRGRVRRISPRTLEEARRRHERRVCDGVGAVCPPRGNEAGDDAARTVRGCALAVAQQPTRVVDSARGGPENGLPATGKVVAWPNMRRPGPRWGEASFSRFERGRSWIVISRTRWKG